MGKPMTISVSNQEKVESLLLELSDLAAMYRGTSGDARQRAIQKYHAVMEALYGMGWEEIISPEDSLPDELMPERYQKRFPDLDDMNAGWLLDRPVK